MSNIPNTTIKRLIHDVKFLIKNPLDNDNIFYHHDEQNILLGYALIIGPKNTPYENGNYLFKFIFPETYPFSPPKVEYYTNDGKTRFNPNLYIDKLVCLSILNTWNGEGWTSCQSIYSILLTLQSLLNENPLLNEPGISMKNPSVLMYNDIISYKNIDFSILKIVKYIIYNYLQINSKNDEYKNIDIKKCDFLSIFSKFFKQILNNFYKNIDILNNFIDNSKVFNEKTLVCRVYSLSTIIVDKKLLKSNINMYKNLIDEYNIINNL